MLTFVYEHVHEQASQIVGQQQKPGGGFRHHAFAAANTVEAALVLQFVEDGGERAYQHQQSERPAAESGLRRLAPFQCLTAVDR